MTTKMISLFAVCVLLGVLMLACGGGADNANTATTNTATTNANTTNANTKTAATPAANTAATPATTTASTGEKIGVAECDDFIQKYEACVTGKVPAAQQATFKGSIEQWRSSWKKLADNPATKGTLASVCKTSLDQAKASLSSYGCTW
jgi:cytoskeletal protein RodZ